jgi:hypothetical protein
METGYQGFRYGATRAYWPLRRFAREFLWIAIRLDASSILTSRCRLVGVAVVLAVARFSLSKGLPPSPLAAVLQCGAVALVAILIGNLCVLVLRAAGPPCVCSKR